MTKVYTFKKASAAKQAASNWSLQDLIDEAASNVLTQYKNDGEVKSESTLFAKDGGRLTLPLETPAIGVDDPNYRLLNAWSILRYTRWTGFSTLRVTAHLNEYVCVAVHADKKEALAVFILNGPRVSLW